jgi:hypothetical protein
LLFSEFKFVFYSIITEPSGNTFTGMSQSNSVTSDLGSPIDSSLTLEEREALRAEWQGELNQVEDEIQTLRQVCHNDKLKTLKG